MNAQTKYQLMSQMGITYWLDRSAPLKSDTPLFCARCLVLLPEKIKQEESEEDKILTGMLSVLGLKKNEIVVAWVNVAILRMELLKWAPETILIMGEDFAKMLLGSVDLMQPSVTIQVTYHPTDLKKSPENKKKAYRDLLSLKEVLKFRKAV